MIPLTPMNGRQRRGDDTILDGDSIPHDYSMPCDDIITQRTPTFGGWARGIHSVSLIRNSFSLKGAATRMTPHVRYVFTSVVTSAIHPSKVPPRTSYGLQL